MSFIAKISTFVNQHLRAICIGLLVVCFMQQCAIGDLRRQLDGLGAETATPPVAGGFSEQVSGNATPETTTPAPTNPSTTTPSPTPYRNFNDSYDNKPQETGTPLWPIVLLAIMLGAGGYLLFKMGKLPFGVAVTGKMWQDLQGRIVYTLTVKNNSRKAVDLADAQLLFRDFKTQRKFRMPVKDLPLTLQPKTSHTMTVQIQRLFELNADLQKMRVIQASIMCGGKKRSTMMQGYKFK